MRDHRSSSLSNILGGLDNRSNKVMIFFDIHMMRFFFPFNLRDIWAETQLIFWEEQYRQLVNPKFSSET